jgi:hypothetical protein
MQQGPPPNKGGVRWGTYLCSNNVCWFGSIVQSYIIIHLVCASICLSLMNERTNERLTFLDDGGEGGSYLSRGGPQFAIDSLILLICG